LSRNKPNTSSMQALAETQGISAVFEILHDGGTIAARYTYHLHEEV